NLPDKIRVIEALRLFASFYVRRRDPAELLRRFGLEEKRNAFYSQLSGGEKSTTSSKNSGARRKPSSSRRITLKKPNGFAIASLSWTMERLSPWARPVS